jgi:hypothetical protein
MVAQIVYKSAVIVFITTSQPNDIRYSQFLAAHEKRKHKDTEQLFLVT